MTEEIPFVLIKCAETQLAIPAQFIDRILDREEVTGLTAVGYQKRVFCHYLGIETDKLTQALVPTYHGNQLWMVSSVISIQTYSLASLYPVPPLLQALQKRFGLAGWIVTQDALIPVIAVQAIPVDNAQTA